MIYAINNYKKNIELNYLKGQEHQTNIINK